VSLAAKEAVPRNKGLTQAATRKQSDSMLMIIAIVLVVLWLLGLFMHIAGGLIHIVLVIALVMFILHMMRGKSA
jgi:Flp pilus assembly protein TadB